MSFCVLVLNGSGLWCDTDWSSFFTINDIQPEEIIPNIFCLGSVNRNLIPTWAPTPVATCHVYLGSANDLHKLLKLNGAVHKDRQLFFERYDPAKSNISHRYQQSSYMGQENAIELTLDEDEHRNSDSEHDNDDQRKPTAHASAKPNHLDADDEDDEFEDEDDEQQTLEKIEDIMLQTSDAADSFFAVTPTQQAGKHKVSFQDPDGRPHTQMNDATFSNARININHNLQRNSQIPNVAEDGIGVPLDLGLIQRMSLKKSKSVISSVETPTMRHDSSNRERRSFTMASTKDVEPLTDFHQILQRLKENKEREVDYNHYITRNACVDVDDGILVDDMAEHDVIAKSKKSFLKRRETYASYLSFQHLKVADDDDDGGDDDGGSGSGGKSKRGRLKKWRTAPKYSMKMKMGGGGGGSGARPSQAAALAHAMKLLQEDDEHDGDDVSDASFLYGAYEVNSDGDGRGSDDEKHSFMDEEISQQKRGGAKHGKKASLSTQNVAGGASKHKRLHSRDHTRQKTLFDCIGSITEKLGIIQGTAAHHASVYHDKNIRAATPPPILQSETQEVEDSQLQKQALTVSVPARTTVKFAEHLDAMHPMKRRRSSLPDNFGFNNNKRFTVNDPNSNWRNEHSFISLKSLQARLVHKNPSKGLQTLQSTMMMEEDEEYLYGFDDSGVSLHSSNGTAPAPAPNGDSGSHSGHGAGTPSHTTYNAMMNKDYHMHEQLMPQTIINIVKGLADTSADAKDYPFTENGFIKCPYEYAYDTVAMFIDVSGFTKMTELLDAEGPWGGEKVAFYLNRYLEQVARIVQSEGGDIFKFAGDAMIIIWPYDDEMHTLSDADELEDFHNVTMARAIQCGLSIQKALHQTQFASGVSLSVKIGIGFGRVKIVFVGGTLDRCEYLAIGEPLSAAFQCEHNATPGDVIIHRTLDQAIDRSSFVTRWITDTNCFKVERQTGRKIKAKRHKHKKKSKKKKYEFVDGDTVKRLNQFIPQAAKLRLVHRYRRWHQESRMMTVIFINLDFERFDKLPISTLQQILETMQIALYRYEGSLNKFMYDDKGATAVAVFGLPPICNFDDPARGIYAALQIERALKNLKGINGVNGGGPTIGVDYEIERALSDAEHECELNEDASPATAAAASRNEDAQINLKLKKVSIGVTSGRVYCGLLGSGGSGCEYGILGDLVNLAARLMQHAGKSSDEGGVLCSKEIQLECEDCRNLRFGKLAPIQVKGKSDHIEIYRPNYCSVIGETIIYRSRYNIGFDREYEFVEEKVKQMIHGKGEAHGVIVCVEGHHWYGSTHFAREIMARLRQYIYIVGASAVKYEETQLVVWQALMARMTRECHLLHGDDEGFKDSVYRFFADTGMQDILPAIWVANDLLGTKFHVDTEQANSIKPEERMNFMVQIVFHFLRVVSQYAPLMLVIVKHQFMSKDDWFLTHSVCTKIKRGELRNVSLLISGWPQRNKSYSNRYSHRDAAMCYQAFREEFCGADDMIHIGGNMLHSFSHELYDDAVHASKKCAITVEIPRWTKTEVEQFLQTEFDIKRCSPLLVKFVHNKSGGIPAMCKALVRHHELVFVKNGGNLDCSAIERLGDLALGFKETDIHFPIPASIQAYFCKMMDSLNDYDNSQFVLITLKAAALICVGQEFQSLAFALDTLRACHPLFNHSDDYFNEEFDDAIEILQFEGFIREGSFDELTQKMSSVMSAPPKNFYFQNSDKQRTWQRPSFYVFCSGFCRDVVYNLMLYKQRSELHKQVSEVLKKYDELLTASNVINNEVRNALTRHEMLLISDGMKSNYEIEEEQKELLITLNPYNPGTAPHGHVKGITVDLYNADSDAAMGMSAVSKPTFASTQQFGQNAMGIDLRGVDTNDVSHMHGADKYDLNAGMSIAPNTYSTLPASVLVVFLIGAKNIPHLDNWQIPNVYVTFHYGSGKEPHLSRSPITSNSDDNDDPVWNEYAAIPLSTDLLLSAKARKLTLKFWDYSPIRPDDDVVLGKVSLDLLQLYEEQIKEQRTLERKLGTPTNAEAAFNFPSVLKKQLEDRDYIYVQKALKIVVDDNLKARVRDNKKPSLFEALFKFCILPSTDPNASMENNSLQNIGQRNSRSLLTLNNVQTSAPAPHGHNLSEFSVISGISHISMDSSAMNLNHMREMSSMPNKMPALNGIGGRTIHHEQESTGLGQYVSSLPMHAHMKVPQTGNVASVTTNAGHENVASFLLDRAQNMNSTDDSYFNLENLESLPNDQFDGNLSQDFGQDVSY